MKVLAGVLAGVLTLGTALQAAQLRPVARTEAARAGAVVSTEQLRPEHRVLAGHLRPQLRPVREAAPELVATLSTMSAPPVRPVSTVVLPMFSARIAVQPVAFLPARVPLAAVPVVAPVSFAPAVVPDLRIEARPVPTVFAVFEAWRPPARPEGITRAAMAIEEERRRGSVCGIPGLQGVVRGSVPGPGSCGVENAVEIRSVAGVTLSSPAVIDCRTATQLHAWVTNAAIPTFAGAGGGLARIDLMGTYSCRTRNSVAGARLSEHAFGRAVDIGGFRLRDGTRVTVLRGWNSDWGQRLRRLHAAACGPFGTVLGPNANAAHRDHFHFDTARYRSGSYCR